MAPLKRPRAEKVIVGNSTGASLQVNQNGKTVVVASLTMQKPRARLRRVSA